jgi:hypothetical protein
VKPEPPIIVPSAPVPPAARLPFLHSSPSSFGVAAVAVKLDASRKSPTPATPSATFAVAPTCNDVPCSSAKVDVGAKNCREQTSRNADLRPVGTSFWRGRRCFRIAWRPKDFRNTDPVASFSAHCLCRSCNGSSSRPAPHRASAPPAFLRGLRSCCGCRPPSSLVVATADGESGQPLLHSPQRLRRKAARRCSCRCRVRHRETRHGTMAGRPHEPSPIAVEVQGVANHAPAAAHPPQGRRYRGWDLRDHNEDDEQHRPNHRHQHSPPQCNTWKDNHKRCAGYSNRHNKHGAPTAPAPQPSNPQQSAPGLLYWPPLQPVQRNWRAGPPRQLRRERAKWGERPRPGRAAGGERWRRAPRRRWCSEYSEGPNTRCYGRAALAPRACRRRRTSKHHRHCIHIQWPRAAALLGQHHHHDHYSDGRFSAAHAKSWSLPSI